MISKEEVEHIAKLSRLELSENDPKGSPEKMQKDLSAILDYFNLLKNAPSPSKILEEQNLGGQARKDEVSLRDLGVAERLIALAPDKKDDYIKVKVIL